MKKIISILVCLLTMCSVYCSAAPSESISRVVITAPATVRTLFCDSVMPANAMHIETSTAVRASRNTFNKVYFNVDSKGTLFIRPNNKYQDGDTLNLMIYTNSKDLQVVPGTGLEIVSKYHNVKRRS